MDVTLQGVDLYAVLDVSVTATDAEIKKAYRDKCFIHHPDHGGNEVEFATLSLAYNKLIDPDERAYFDRTGQIKEQSNLEKDAWGLLGSIFKGMVEREGPHIFQTDVIENMSQQVKKPIGEGKTRIRQRKAKIEVLNKIKEKLTRDLDTPPVFETAIDEEIQQAERDIADAEDAMELAEMAINLLPKYKFAHTFQSTWENKESALSSYNPTTVHRPKECNGRDDY